MSFSAGGRSWMDSGKSELALLAKIPDWAILVFFFGVMLLQAIPSMVQKSATFDGAVRQYPGYLPLRLKS